MRGNPILFLSIYAYLCVCVYERKNEKERKGQASEKEKQSSVASVNAELYFSPVYSMGLNYENESVFKK